jgi:hypothetical protein
LVVLDHDVDELGTGSEGVAPQLSGAADKGFDIEGHCAEECLQVVAEERPVLVVVVELAGDLLVVGGVADDQFKDVHLKLYLNRF